MCILVYTQVHFIGVHSRIHADMYSPYIRIHTDIIYTNMYIQAYIYIHKHTYTERERDISAYCWQLVVSYRYLNVSHLDN